MMRSLLLHVLILAATVETAAAINAPTGFVISAGDQSIVLHWDPVGDPALAGYRVYRSSAGGGPFVALNSAALTSPGYCDLAVFNAQTNFYRVTAVANNSQESIPSPTLPAVSNPFAGNDEFLDYIQQTSFDYFWYTANPANGLVPDRSAAGSACSIAAVGFGLTAIGIAIDHGWISRSQGAGRVLTTLNTFFQGPQGPGASGNDRL